MQLTQVTINKNQTKPTFVSWWAWYYVLHF